MSKLNRRQFLRLSALSALSAVSVAAGGSLPPLAHAITLTPTPSPLPPINKNFSGLFVMLPLNAEVIPPEVLASPFVTGVTLPIHWSKLHPKADIVVWDVVDRMVEQVKAAKKVLAIRPIAGVGAPDWLYENSVRRYTLTPISDLTHPLEFGKEVSLPIPWDKIMLDWVEKFAAILAQRVDNDPAIVRVSVTGPVFARSELYFPRAGADAPVIEDFTKLGYTLGLIQNTWYRAIDIFGATFKNTTFSLDLNPLPDPTDKSGSSFNSLVPIAIGRYGLRRYPGRFVPGNSDFADVYPYLPPPVPGPKNPPAVFSSYERQMAPIFDFLREAAVTTPIGLTVLEGRMSKEPGYAKAALDRALALKAGYIEIPSAWVLDAANADALKGWTPVRRLPPTNTPAPTPTTTKPVIVG